MKFALRSLARQPGFTTTVVLTLAIGIGAMTTICSVVKTVLLQPLPLHEAHRLARVVEHDRPRGLPAVSYREYREWQPRMTTVSDLTAMARDSDVVMPAPTGAVRVNGAFVSTNYFAVLGAPPLLGRTFAPTDATADVMILGHAAWQRHFASNPQVVGTVIPFRSGALAGRALTVIGVMPESLETIDALSDLYMPIGLRPQADTIALESMIGRLRDGTSLAAASQEANAIGMAIRPPRPPSAAPLTTARFEARRFDDGLLEPRPGRQMPTDLATITSILQVFLGAVLVVLLIVCANVAHLLLARGTARRREFATRLALGASRWHLLRQMLAEGVVLATAGGLIGAALAAAGVSIVKRMATVDAQGVFRIVFGTSLLPRANEIAVDWSLLGIALAVSAIATLTAGLLPALHQSRTNQVEVLGTRGTSSTRRDTRVRMALVIGELAMATILLVGAALLTTSFTRLAAVPKGYDPTNVVAFQLVLPAEYPTARKGESIEAVLRAVRAIPEVSSAGFAYAGIMIGLQDTVGAFVPPGRALDDVLKEPDKPRLKSLSAGYLETAGVSLLDGRLLAETDSPDAPPVIVINRSVQRRYFGDASPVGAFIDWHGGRGPHVPVRIVGVVADVRQGALAREPYPEVFMDYRQVMALQTRWRAPTAMIERLAFGFMSFAVRTRTDPAAVVPAVRQAINRADPNAALDAIMPLDSLVANSVARHRFYAVMLTAFAAVAALLAAIGIYGVLAYAIVERTQEIGVRMALGAQRRQVLALVLRRGLTCAVIGIVLGLAGAAAGTRYLQAMLYGVTPLDRATFVIVALTFAAVATIASYVPARRATRIDPMEALRIE